MGNRKHTTSAKADRREVAVHCLTCDAQDRVTVPDSAWRNWIYEEHTPAAAFRGVGSDVVRYLTTSMCVDCYAAILTSSTETYWAEILCPGCGTWESVAVPAPALTAYRRGELTEHQAFPALTFTQHTLIECGWHPDCWDHAVHHQPDRITSA